MMLDDGDYIVIGKLIPEGECRGKDIQRCYVSFTYVMIGIMIHTRAYTHVHQIAPRVFTNFLVFTKTKIFSMMALMPVY